MTSISSFFSISFLKNKLLRSIWLPSILSMLLFFALPVVSALNTVNNDMMSNMPDIITIRWLIPFIALVTALVSFHYLNKKTQVDFFHSQPIKRISLFISTYASGVLTFVVPYAVFWSLAFIVSMPGAAAIPALVIDFFTNILFFFVLYSIAAAVCMLCGNTVVSAFLTSVVFLYVPLLWGFMVENARVFYETIYSPSYGTFFAMLSPAMHFFEFNDIAPISLAWTLFYIAFSVAVTAAAFLLYHLRASEAAGKSLVFKVSVPVVKHMIMLVAIACAGFLFYSIGGYSVSWLIFGYVSVGFISFGLLNSVLYLDFKSFFRGWKIMLAFSAALAILITGVAFDVTGYDSANVRREDVVSVNFSCMLFYDKFNSYEYGFDWHTGNIFLEEAANLDSAVEMQHAAAENRVNVNQNKYYDYYDKLAEPEKSYSTVDMYFTLKSGADFSRQYMVENSYIEKHMRDILGTDEFKRTSFLDPLDEISKKEISHFGISSMNGAFDILSHNTRKKFIEAIKKDIEAHDFSSDSRNALYTVSILSGAYDDVVSVSVPIFGDFINTLPLLEEQGSQTDG